MIIFLLFIGALFFPFYADAATQNCSTTLFATGSPTQALSFPAGGGINLSAKVSLPIGAIIGLTQVDLVAGTLIGTPYIWVPKSVVAGQIVQIDTNTGAIVNTYNVGNNPSRVTVMPGADVWVANRDSANLTRLSPAVPPNYSVSGTYPVGSGPRGVTFDYKGNIWAFDYYDNTVWKFTAPTYTSSTFANTAGYPYIYGAIGDPYGYVWMVGDLDRTGNRRVNILNTKTNNISLAGSCSIGGSTYIYGIGMDNQGNIYVANYGGGGYCKIGGARSGANFGVVTQSVAQAGITGSRGITVDRNGYIWMANSTTNHVYVFDSAGTLKQDITTGYSDIVGIAIDFNNNAWVVSEASSHVIQYKAAGTAGEYTVLRDITLGGSLYNYSDMTGFRSTPTVMSIGTTEYFPTSGNTYTGFGNTLQAALVGCSCLDTDGNQICSVDPSDPANCLVPLSLFSSTGGDYNAKNLSISCTTVIPSTFGGLVPCGRNENDPNTTWDDSAPCNLCFAFQMAKNILDYIFFLTVGLAIFIFVIAGLLYAFSMGNPGRIEKAKQAITLAIIGLAIIFVAWLIVNVVLAALGYTHPFGGSWNMVDCSLP